MGTSSEFFHSAYERFVVERDVVLFEVDVDSGVVAEVVVLGDGGGVVVVVLVVVLVVVATVVVVVFVGIEILFVVSRT